MTATTTDVDLDVDLGKEVPCDGPHGESGCDCPAAWRGLRSCGCPPALLCETCRAMCRAASAIVPLECRHCERVGITVTWWRL
jgi:hypothetical protein